MHELSLCEAMIGQLKYYQAANPAHRVAAVDLVVGQLSGVDPEALKFAWPAAQECAGFSGIELKIDRRPVTVKCDICAAESEVADFTMKCRVCGSEQVKIAGGRELRIRSFEIEEEDHV